MVGEGERGNCGGGEGGGVDVNLSSKQRMNENWRTNGVWAVREAVFPLAQSESH